MFGPMPILLDAEMHSWQTTRSKAERVQTFRPTRSNLLKLEIDVTHHISGLDCNVQRINLTLIDTRHVTIFVGLN